MLAARSDAIAAANDAKAGIASAAEAGADAMHDIGTAASVSTLHIPIAPVLGSMISHSVVELLFLGQRL